MENILEAIRWHFSLGNKFLRVTPILTSLIVCLTLLSQSALLFASYLPLKIIMLLGRETVPSYFPDIFLEVNRDTLIVALCCLTIVFFLTHFISEHLITYISNRGAVKLVAKNRKIVLFQGQEEVSIQSYQRYARSLAAGIFVFLVITLFLIVYASLAIFILLYVFVVMMMLTVLCSVSKAFLQAVNESFYRILNISATLGFLSSFTFIVYQYLSGKKINLLILIVCLLLTRQAIGKLSALIKDFYYLNSRKRKLRALFFHKYVLMADKKEYKSDYWNLFNSDKLKQWIPALIKNVSDVSGELEIKWLQVGVLGVFGFQVYCCDEHRGKNHSFLIKLFDQTRESQASYESTILLYQNELPGLKLLEVDRVASFICHVYEEQGLDEVPASKVKDAVFEVRAELMSIEPSAKLVSSYLRSHPCLWERLNRETLRGVEIAASNLGEHVSRQFYEFLENFEDIVARLKSLPLTIVNPDISVDKLLVNSRGHYLATHWGRWSLEPVGSGWPVSSNGIYLLRKLLPGLMSKRISLSKVAQSDVCLSAFVFAFDGFCQKQKYVYALELLPNILNLVRSTPSVIDDVS